ncbi:MAG TPA: hypothetical protein VGM56_13510 [Byssovorax sp.]|jgi:hypothetical protein
MTDVERDEPIGFPLPRASDPDSPYRERVRAPIDVAPVARRELVTRPEPPASTPRFDLAGDPTPVPPFGRAGEILALAWEFAESRPLLFGVLVFALLVVALALVLGSVPASLGCASFAG